MRSVITDHKHVPFQHQVEAFPSEGSLGHVCHKQGQAWGPELPFLLHSTALLPRVVNEGHRKRKQVNSSVLQTGLCRLTLLCQLPFRGKWQVPYPRVTVAGVCFGQYAPGSWGEGLLGLFRKSTLLCLREAEPSCLFQTKRVDIEFSSLHNQTETRKQIRATLLTKR